MRCIFALSHHGDLIALLGKLHIHIQPHHQRQNDQNGQQVAVGADGRQPSLLALAVDQAHMIGAAGVFPKHDGEGHQLHGDIVEHQGKQGFIGVPVRLEKRGDHAPDQAGGHARHGAECIHRPGGQVLSIDHHGGRGHGAHQHLSLRAHIPEPHTESGQHRKTHTKQNRRVAEGDPHAAVGAHRAVPDSRIDVERVHAGQAKDDGRAHQQGKYQRDQPHQHGPAQRHAVALDNMHQGFLCTGHACASFAS